MLVVRDGQVLLHWHRNVQRLPCRQAPGRCLHCLLHCHVRWKLNCRPAGRQGVRAVHGLRPRKDHGVGWCDRLRRLRDWFLPGAVGSHGLLGVRSWHLVQHQLSRLHRLRCGNLPECYTSCRVRPVRFRHVQPARRCSLHHVRCGRVECRWLLHMHRVPSGYLQRCRGQLLHHLPLRKVLQGRIRDVLALPGRQALRRLVRFVLGS